jgi:Lrp/AsnC family leucine-responsive transcriptional regulator
VDKIDWEIVRSLEQDARISFAELGQRVGLSKTPCWQRVRDLEHEGLIRGYRAELDAERLGLRVHAFVYVSIDSTRYLEFEAAVACHSAVLQCYTTAGQADYLMHVLVSEIAELDTLLRTQVSRMPGVQRVETTVCLKTIKSNAPLSGCVAP